jgi:hypothetical protein
LATRSPVSLQKPVTSMPTVSPKDDNNIVIPVWITDMIVTRQNASNRPPEVLASESPTLMPSASPYLYSGPTFAPLNGTPEVEAAVDPEMSESKVPFLTTVLFVAAGVLVLAAILIVAGYSVGRYVDERTPLFGKATEWDVKQGNLSSDPTLYEHSARTDDSSPKHSIFLVEEAAPPFGHAPTRKDAMQHQAHVQTHFSSDSSVISEITFVTTERDGLMRNPEYLFI